MGVGIPVGGTISVLFSDLENGEKSGSSSGNKSSSGSMCVHSRATWNTLYNNFISSGSSSR